MKNHYDLALDEIRPTYSFVETCLESVPQAIEAFLESTSFEDAIRNAISIGGDGDTIGAIAGSIAEDVRGINSVMTLLREQLAKVAALTDVVVRRQPRFLGLKEALPE